MRLLGQPDWRLWRWKLESERRQQRWQQLALLDGSPSYEGGSDVVEAAMARTTTVEAKGLGRMQDAGCRLPAVWEQRRWRRGG